MRLTVVPPLADPTLRVTLPPGEHLLDLNAAFLERLTAAAVAGTTDAGSATPVPGDGADAGVTSRDGDGGSRTPVEGVFGAAAAAILARGRPDEAHLRALGHVLRTASADDAAISLTLDDVTLRGGTTQSSADLLAAATATELFAPELAHLREVAVGARVRIVVHTDQQMPAAVAIARSLGSVPIRWCGPYVAEHHRTLRRIPWLPPADWDGVEVHREIRAEWTAEGSPVRWVTGLTGLPPAGRWAGWLDAAVAARVPAHVLADCAGLTVTVARAVDWPTVVCGSGEPVDLGPLLAALPAGTPLALDLLVGAPGVSEADLDDTVARLAAHGPEARVAGFRPFRLRREHTRWDSRISRIPSPHDLALWDEVGSADAMPAAVLTETVHRLLRTHSARLNLFPGRVAAAVVAPTRGEGPGLHWDSSAALVGTGGSVHHVVSLRTGRVLRVSSALTPTLGRWERGERQVPRPQDGTRTATLVGRLIDTGVIRGSAPDQGATGTKRVWRLTGELVLRHAGMPFDWLEELGADAGLLAAADDVLDREAELLGGLDRHAPALTAALRRCQPDGLPERVQRDLPEAVQRWRSAVERYVDAYATADRDASARLLGLLDRDEVRHAVFLSNPDAYHHMLVPFLGHDKQLNSRWRRVRRQLYTYVQRFCAKNETVSFFGPMAYGHQVPGNGVALRTGLPRTSRVFLSHWAVRQLCRAISRDSRILPLLTFRRTGRPWSGTDALTRRILAALPEQGATLRALRRTGVPADALLSTLRALVAEGVLDLELGGGPYDPTPLDTLRDQLHRLPDTAARDEWLKRLDEFEELRAGIESGTFSERLHLVPALERAFEASTGGPARRGAGQAYADRAVFFEECSSPFALRIGAQTLRDWAHRLTPLLEACVAHGARTQAAARERVLTAWPADWPEAVPLLEYAQTMAEVFTPSGSVFQPDHVPRYDVATAAEVVPALTAAAGQLPGDRYAVIDLCPRAADTALLSDATLLLARVHHHLQVDGWLATMHPDRAGFAADAARWLAGPGRRVVGFDFGRRNKGFYLFPGRRVVLRAPSWQDSNDVGVLFPEDLSVVREAGRLALRDRTGELVESYLPLSDFVKYPPYAALSHPQVALPPFTGTGERPLESGGITYQRRRWEVEPDGPAAMSPAAYFLQLRRLARRTGCRFVFYRSDHERKPYLLDLAAPLAADLWAYLSRQGGRAAVEEMLPAPDELWLRDAAGRRYTCELRVQVIGRDGER